MEGRKKGVAKRSGVKPDDLDNDLDYQRLKKALDELPDESREKFVKMLTDTEKTFHSGRGGYRGGIKPKIDPELKRERFNIRLPAWMIKKLKKQGNAGRIIENALEKMGFIKD